MMDPQKCDWRALPRAIVAQAALLLQPMGVADPLILEETLLYASVDPTRETALKDWLTNTIDRMPSYRVRIRERQPQPKTIRIPAVEYLQNVGLKVINAGWSKRGHDLKRACWASFDLERVAVNIVRR